MASQATRRAATGAAARLVAGALALGSMLALPATAFADPDPAPPPAPVPGLTGTSDAYSPDPPPNVPPPSTLGSPLAQNGKDIQGPGGLPSVIPDMSQDNPSEYLLAQNQTPKLPGGDPAAATNPHLNPLNNQYILPQNVKPAGPGKGQLYDVDAGSEDADISNTDLLHHLWKGYQDGQWNGTMVGRRPKEQLNEPLPGTAPPPGTRIPGLGDDSQGPAPDQWHWTPPDPPEGAPAPAPGPGAPAAPAPPPAS